MQLCEKAIGIAVEIIPKQMVEVVNGTIRLEQPENGQECSSLNYTQKEITRLRINFQYFLQ